MSTTEPNREIAEPMSAVFLEWNGSNSGIIGEAEGRHRVPPGLEGVVSCDELTEAITDPVRTVITPDGWKLNHSPRAEHELYNLSSDPGETENLFYRKDSEPIIDKLTEKITRWQQQTGDSDRQKDKARLNKMPGAYSSRAADGLTGNAQTRRY